MLTAVLGPVCTALTVALVWPQVFRVHRSRTVEGLSAFGILQGLAGSALWAMYGVAQGIVAVAVSNAAVAVALAMIALAQIQHRALTWRALVATVVGTAVVGVGALALSTVVAGWLALVIGVTSILPQTVHVARVTELAGVSLPMYALVVTSSVLWVVYGSLIGAWLVVLTNALVLPCALFVSARAWAARPARRVPAPEVV